MNNFIKRWHRLGLALIVVIATIIGLAQPRPLINYSGKFVGISLGSKASAAGGVTALGVNTDKAGTSPWTAFSSISVSAGDTLVVMFGFTYGGSNPSATYGSSAMTEYHNNSSSTLQVFLFYKQFTGSDTQNITITNTSTLKGASLYRLTGLVTSNVIDDWPGSWVSGTASDQTTVTISTGRTPDSWVQNDMVIIGCSVVNDEVDDAHGTITTGAGYVDGNEQFSATNGGGDSSNVQIHSSAEVVTSNTNAVTFQDGAHDNVSMAAAIVGFIVSTGATPSISNSPTSLDMGTLTSNTTYYAKGSAPSNPVQDSECTFTMTIADATANVSIKATDWTGGVGWTLTASAPGANEVRMTAYYSGQNPASGVVLTTSNQTFKTSVAAGTLKWDFKVEVGTNGDGVTKVTVITLSCAAA